MLTKEEHAERYALYKKGLSDAKIGEALHISPNTITVWRKKNHIPANPSKYSKDPAARAAIGFDRDRKQLYDKGYTDEEIAAALGEKPYTIKAWRCRKGLRSQNRRKHGKV